MSLCFLEGPEAGIGRPLGKYPEKWPMLWDLGWSPFTLNTLVVLDDPWQCQRKRRDINRNNQRPGVVGGLRWKKIIACCGNCCHSDLWVLGAVGER
ncbi:hypothetical protein NL676_014120 [Syzygium grande]|nr:hypothetical protein NL676_014120 [Syzygium grande]